MINVQNRIAQILRAAGYAPGEVRTFFSMLSTGADLIPIVGNIKSAIEGIVGFDLITGEKLSKWDRFLYVATAAIPGGGEVKAALKAGGKALREEKLVAHATEAIATTCGRCFEGGTMVETRAGPKKVEDVQVSDEVLSKDETDGTIAYKAVTTTFTREADKIYRVGIGDQTVSVTAEHPFYVHNIGWTRVENLKPGDRLDTRYGMTLEIKTIDVAEKPTQVYNFTVADYHSYFVTSLQIYTHNQSCGRASDSYGELRKANLKDAHHIIQDAAVRELQGYDKNLAPAVHLEGPSNVKGTPHNLTRDVQRQSGGGTYAAERRIGYKALRRAGIEEDEARQLISQADDYFESINVTGDTVTRIPGDRKR